MKSKKEMQTKLSPEDQQYLIQQQIKDDNETKKQLSEMEKNIYYSEKISLRELKLEAFRLALNIKPQPTYNPMGGQSTVVNFTTDDFIKSANKIYDELIK